MYMLEFVIACVCLILHSSNAAEPVIGCRYRSSDLRQDGSLCFEIAPWQHRPVELDEHINSVKSRWGTNITRRDLIAPLGLGNSEINVYMDTVLAPFLETYHRNIQSSYQQLTNKILSRIKDEINSAIQKKQQIYAELIQLADELKVPAMCDEERRNARTIASKHVSQTYACSETARASIAKMGKYAEEMIDVTKRYLHATLMEVNKKFQPATKIRTILSTRDQRAGFFFAQRLSIAIQRGNAASLLGTLPSLGDAEEYFDALSEIDSSLKQLSKTAVLLGYELDLSLTHAKRHHEQSCEKFTSCTTRTRKRTDDGVLELKNQLNYCVYA